MSGLANYASASLKLAEELRTSLTEKEIAELHRAWYGRPVIDWIRWRDDNKSLVFEFVASTPSVRAKREKFKESRLHLTMAGVECCLEAHALLTVVTNSWLVPGGSYRSMAVAAGDAYNGLFDFEVPYWPFDELKSPFSDDPFVNRD